MVGEPTGARLVTVHNVRWILALMERLRCAVADGTLATLRAELTETWAREEEPSR
jgi:tRNA-guanine family transglycosylase